MTRKVTLKQKYEEYGIPLHSLRSRRGDHKDFPAPVGKTSDRYAQYLYDEKQLDYWFYKIYIPNRPNRPFSYNKNFKGPKIEKAEKIETVLTFDQMAVLFLAGRLDGFTAA